jgi:hypothetical protein
MNKTNQNDLQSVTIHFSAGIDKLFSTPKVARAWLRSHGLSVTLFTKKDNGRTWIPALEMSADEREQMIEVTSTLSADKPAQMSVSDFVKALPAYEVNSAEGPLPFDMLEIAEKEAVLAHLVSEFQYSLVEAHTFLIGCDDEEQAVHIEAALEGWM